MQAVDLFPTLLKKRSRVLLVPGAVQLLSTVESKTPHALWRLGFWSADVLTTLYR